MARIRKCGHLADYFDSNGKLRGMKRDLTEGGIRVPTIAWWPGTIKAGSADDAHWYFGDFMATLADLSGYHPRISTATALLDRSRAHRAPINGSASTRCIGSSTNEAPPGRAFR